MQMAVPNNEGNKSRHVYARLGETNGRQEGHMDDNGQARKKNKAAGAKA